MNLFKTTVLVLAILPYLMVQADDTPKAAIIKAVDKIKADGILDEKTWKIANKYQIDWIFGGKSNGKLSAEPRGVVQYAWDNNYFYIAYRVYDKNIVNLPSGEEQGPKDNRRMGLLKYDKEVKVDFAMFLISLGSRNFLWELDHNASNNFNDIFVIVPEDNWPLYNSSLAGKSHIIECKAEFIKDQNEIDWDTGEQGVFKLQMGTTLYKSTIAHDNNKTDQDKGYTGEIRIPWDGLGGPMDRKKGFNYYMDGKVIRVLAIVRNGDLPVPYHASAKLESGFAHKQVRNWPAFVLKK